MEMIIELPGGARVDAHFRGHAVKTDQHHAAGGEDSAASPFETFLASIGTCAGIYIVGFCKSRHIPYDKIKIFQRHELDGVSGMVTKITLNIQLPPDFPDKYKSAVIRAADQCKVKKHLEHPPLFEVNTVTVA